MVPLIVEAEDAQMAQKFLVNLSGKYYFHSCAEGVVAGCLVPSLGTFLSYDAAAEIVRRLRALGYYDAYICNSRGLPAMPEDMAQMTLRAEVDEVNKVWSLA